MALWRAGELEPSGPDDGRPPDKPARDGSVPIVRDMEEVIMP